MRRSYLGQFQINLCRLGQASGIDQRVGKPAFEINQLSATHRGQLEGATIKAGGSIEGESTGRFSGSDSGVRRGPRPFAGAQIMFKQGFWIIDAAGFECLGQAAMDVSYFFRIKLRSDGFANAIVIKLECMSWSPGSQKLRCSQ